MEKKHTKKHRFSEWLRANRPLTAALENTLCLRPLSLLSFIYQIRASQGALNIQALICAETLPCVRLVKQHRDKVNQVQVHKRPTGLQSYCAPH